MDHEVPPKKFNFDVLEIAYSYWKGGFPEYEKNEEMENEVGNTDIRVLM